MSDKEPYSRTFQVINNRRLTLFVKVLWSFNELWYITDQDGTRHYALFGISAAPYDHYTNIYSLTILWLALNVGIRKG